MKRIVLVGGGHAHMTVMSRADEILRRGHEVILIGPHPYHYYSGMGPGMLAGNYRPQDIRFNIKKMIEERGGTFIEDSVSRIDPDKKTLFLKSGETVSYSIVSFNIGSHVPSDIATQKSDFIYTVKPIINLHSARKTIINWPSGKSLRILVAGGGPAGVEVTGCVWELTSSLSLKASITLVTGSTLLKGFPRSVTDIIRKTYERRGIRIIEGERVKNVKGNLAYLTNGDVIKSDIVFLSVGIRPPEVFRASGLRTGPEGGLLVNQYLQHPDHPEIFGGGDCIYFEPRPLEKVGVYAVRENPVLFHNLLAMAEGRPLMEFDPGGRYLLIFNLGGKRGLFYRGNLVFNGKLAFLIKDYIDRRFMRRFQLSGERSVRLVSEEKTDNEHI